MESQDRGALSISTELFEMLDGSMPQAPAKESMLSQLTTPPKAPAGTWLVTARYCVVSLTRGLVEGRKGLSEGLKPLVALVSYLLWISRTMVLPGSSTAPWT
jgi:hypothetical protein